MGHPDPTLQGTIVSLYDIGWCVPCAHLSDTSHSSHFLELLRRDGNIWLRSVLLSLIWARLTCSVGERYGRKKTFLVGVVVMSIGAVLQACAFSVPHMVVARLITGNWLTDAHDYLILDPGYHKALEMGKIFPTLLFCKLDGPCSINTATAPVWQSETSKPSWRGKLVVFEMMFVPTSCDFGGNLPTSAA